MPTFRRPKMKFPTPTTVDRALDNLLEGYYPPPTALRSHGMDKLFSRRHDDTDGERGPEQDLSVMFSADGDAWVVVGCSPSLRFRTDAGGGLSPHVHKALIVLAEAIRRDNEARPQRD